MALSAATSKVMRILNSAPVNYRVANGITIYLGGFVGIANASFVTTAKRGYLIPWENTANLEWAGIAIGSPFNLSTSNTVVGNTSGTPVPECSVETGEIMLVRHAVTGASAQSDVGKPVYGTDDDVLTLSSNNTTRMGEVEYWHSSTSCDVRVLGRAIWLTI